MHRDVKSYYMRSGMDKESRLDVGRGQWFTDHIRNLTSSPLPPE